MGDAVKFQTPGSRPPSTGNRMIPIPLLRPALLTFAMWLAFFAPLRAQTASDKTLWFQADDTENVGVQINSQNFEPEFDVYDSQGADDFIVPGGEVWIVRQIDVIGTYGEGTGPARSENVVFYRDEGGSPGPKINAYPELVGEDRDWGAFLIALPSPLKLRPGHYWLSVQANMDFSTGGQWGWWTNGVRRGARASWKNPGGGFGVGCQHYEVMRHCIGRSGEGPDFMFAVYGTRQFEAQ
jgi:hypothetical protein